MNALKRAKLRIRPSGDNDVIVLTRAEFRKLRPSRHPIVLGVWFAFGLVSLVQLFRGTSPASVNTHFDVLVQGMLAVIVVLAVVLNIGGAWIPNDKFSLGCEIGGLILAAAAFTVYAGIIATTVQFWAASTGAAWSLGMLAGTLGRTVQIFRRGW